VSPVAREKVFAAEWPAFERQLSSLHARIEQTVPEFESLFQRKTFNEPLARCTAQTWVERYVGARETRELLAGHEQLVNRACPPWQRDLFDQLQAELDGYAMDMKSLLIRTRRFELQKNGTLAIHPGIHETCEGRRKSIRAIVSRILDPLDVPLTAEAAAWANAETFEQRKHYIHRLEHRVRTWASPLEPRRPTAGGRRQASRTAARTARSIELLLDGHELHAFEGSGWELDRIFACLVVERFAARLKRRSAKGAARAADTARREIERLQSRGPHASLAPLHYALRAFAATLPDRLGRDTRRLGRDLIAAARELIRAAPESRDRGRQLTTLLDRLEDRVGSTRNARTAAPRTRGASPANPDQPAAKRTTSQRRTTVKRSAGRKR
jgi:hypothetical protein